MTATAAAKDGGLFLLTPDRGPKQNGAGQQGLMLLDAAGELVWFLPTSSEAADLQVQQYQGKPVLTWWQGAVTTTGIGQGGCVIYDTTYRQVATVKCGNGYKADLHEFVLTAEDTALVTAFGGTKADLSSVKGPKSGVVYDGIVQEIDVASGKVLFEWHSLEHIAFSESYALPPTEPFDYFHINSVAVDPTDNNLVISARNTWAIYKVDRKSGAVIWRLGGKRSDFAMGSGSRFAWQHHARPQNDGTLSMFDDEAWPQEASQSRGLVLSLDEKARTAKFVRQFTYPSHVLAGNQGSCQLVAGGGAIIGWGDEPYVTQFAADGSVVFDGRLPVNDQSYRAFRAPWTGVPATLPAVAVEGGSGKLDVYASWNGATEVVSWRILSGNSPSTLAPLSTFPKVGFETTMSAVTTDRYLVVTALDAGGKELARSDVVTV